ncbi:MAG: putative S-layer protein [Candidatus Pacearchaeota archaeon]|nr:putative S-layer protein [Candidatus Pacearchaeota archaeon]
MKTKKIISFVSYLFLALSLISFVSAAASLSLSSTQSLTKTQNGILNITNTGNETLSNINLSSSGAFSVSFSTNNFALAPNQSLSITVSSTTNFSSLGLGEHSTTITAKDLSTSAQATYSYTISNDFCKSGNTNASSITIDEIDDVSSGTEDDWEWKPLDKIKIEVEIENQLDEEEDFVIVLGIYDTQKKKFVEIDDEEYLEEEISLEESGEKDSGKVTFEFEVPTEMEKSSERYVLFVKAYVDGKESSICNSGAGNKFDSSVNQYIKINKKKHDVIIRDISAPSVAVAGETITITGKAYNIGSNDEDEVKISLKNTKLGISGESSSFELEAGDSESFEITFTIPSNAESGTYTFSLDSHFYYDDKKETYRETSEQTWKVDVKVIGKTTPSIQTQSKIAVISAYLDSNAIAGEEMTIKATITNILSNKTTFSISARGYNSWAKLNSISPETLTLNAGESKEITLTLTPNSNSSGEQSFFIDVSANGKTESKELALTIEESSLVSKIRNSFQNNSMVWIIGIINLILLILIILVIARILAR